MRDDNEPLFELSMGRGPSLNEQYAKIEVQQQALQQEIDQGLHEPAIAKGMQPIRDKMEEDSSFEGLSEAEKNALARYAAEELLVYGAPNVKITDAYINPNDGEAEFEINGFTLVNFAPETAYNKFMPDVTESVPSITQPLEKTPETNPLETNPLETNPLEAPAPEPQTFEPQTLQERVEAANQTIAEIEALNTDMEHMTLKEFDEFIRSERSAELFNPESLAHIGQALQEKGHGALVAIEEKYGSAVAGFAKDALTTTMDVAAIVSGGVAGKGVQNLANNTFKNVRAIQQLDPNRMLRVTQYYDPSKGSFPIDGKYILSAKPDGFLTKYLDGIKVESTWIAPFAVEEMGYAKRLLTGVSNRSHYVEFNALVSELKNTGGVKILHSKFQKIIEGKIDLTERNPVFGVQAVSKADAYVRVGAYTTTGATGYYVCSKLDYCPSLGKNKDN